MDCVYLWCIFGIQMTNTMTKISDAALDHLRASKKLKGLLAIHFDKHYNTIENWVKHKDAMLTTPDAVRIISENTELRAEDILVIQEENQAA